MDSDIRGTDIMLQNLLIHAIGKPNHPMGPLTATVAISTLE